jgi:hypothetical protein
VKRSGLPALLSRKATWLYTWPLRSAHCSKTSSSRPCSPTRSARRSARVNFWLCPTTSSKIVWVSDCPIWETRCERSSGFLSFWLRLCRVQHPSSVCGRPPPLRPPSVDTLWYSSSVNCEQIEEGPVWPCWFVAVLSREGVIAACKPASGERKRFYSRRTTLLFHTGVTQRSSSKVGCGNDVPNFV